MEIWRRRTGRGTNTSGIRSGALLNSCPSFQIREAWVFHNSVVRTGKTGGSKRDEEECNSWDASSFLPQEETIAGFPSASLPLYSSPTQQGFNSKAAEVISFLLIYTFLQGYLIQVYLMTGQVLQWTCMGIFLVLYFFSHLACFVRRQRQMEKKNTIQRIIWYIGIIQCSLEFVDMLHKTLV